MECVGRGARDVRVPPALENAGLGRTPGEQETEKTVAAAAPGGHGDVRTLKRLRQIGLERLSLVRVHYLAGKETRKTCDGAGSERALGGGGKSPT